MKLNSAVLNNTAGCYRKYASFVLLNDQRFESAGCVVACFTLYSRNEVVFVPYSADLVVLASAICTALQVSQR